MVAKHLNELSYQLSSYRLRKDLVHTGIDRPADIMLFTVPRHGYNQWLLYLILKQKASYFISRFISVHHRHVTIHENQIVTAFFQIYLKIFFYDFKSFLAIVSFLTYFLDIYFGFVLQDDLESLYVKTYIVNNQNLFILIWNIFFLIYNLFEI